MFPPKCSKCSNIMKIGKAKNLTEQYGWRCHQQQCDKKLRCIVTQNPLFEGFRVRLQTLLKLYLQYFPSLSTSLSILQQLNLNHHQLALGRKRWQEVIINYYFQQHQSIILGRNGEVIKIGESHFKRKHNKGRYIVRNQWVIGITERGGDFNRTILIPVERRNQETLLPLIETYVSKKCTLICTDEWRGYKNLSKLGYTHKTVNHSANFVAPSSSQQSENKRNYCLYYGHPIHTQTIENRWKYLKQKLSTCRGQQINYLSDKFATQFYLSFKDTLEVNALRIIQQYINKCQSQTESEMEIEEQVISEETFDDINKDEDDITNENQQFQEHEPQSDSEDEINEAYDQRILKQFKQIKSRKQ